MARLIKIIKYNCFIWRIQWVSIVSSSLVSHQDRHKVLLSQRSQSLVNQTDLTISDGSVEVET